MSGLSAFSGLVGLARGLKDINDAVVRNDAIYELTSKLLDAQQEYATLLKRVGELEAKLAQFENWESEKQRYELKKHGNALAYALKEGVNPPEHPHFICPDCYQHRKKTIVQEERRIGGAEVLACYACGWTGHMHGFSAGTNVRAKSPR